MARKKKTPTMTKARRERCARALQLREQGATYEQIASTLGISRTQAYNDVQDSLREITRDDADAVLDMELRRLDRLWQVVYRDALEGNLKAVDRAISIHDRRARLFGLYTIKHEVNGEILEALSESFKTFDETPLMDFIDDDDEYLTDFDE